MSAIEQNEYEYVKMKAEQIRAILKSKHEIDLDFLIINLKEVYDKAWNDSRELQKKLNKQYGDCK